MKKRVFAIFACTIFTLALVTGCQKAPAPETPDSSAPAAEADALKPLTTEEVEQMYADATDIYADISMLTFPVDSEHTIIQDDITYHRMDDERFDSYESFQKYLNQYFTINMVNTDLLKGRNFVEGKDGYLYMADAGRGSNLFYAGYVMHEPTIAEDEITLNLTAYYTADDEPYTGQGFTAEPENPEDFRTEDYQFTLLPEDGVWKFETFRVFY
ncbi:MAG: hypothetical protein II313_03875 [Anaerotignum sp.]|nr:hypothetical protein [Anaerotignum sp.]